MNIEQIEKFLESQEPAQPYVKIDFKKRDPIYGLFVKSRDFQELKSKNLWRIVTRMNFAEWDKSKKIELAKIFNGSDFVKIATYKEPVKQ